MGTAAEIELRTLRNQQGFTLIEIIVVMVIIGVLSSSTIYRYYELSDAADSKVLATGLRELNIRETLVWTQFKTSISGWPGDQEVFDSVDKHLGEGFYWLPAVQKMGGSLHYHSRSVSLVRAPSTAAAPATWDEET